MKCQLLVTSRYFFDRSMKSLSNPLSNIRTISISHLQLHSIKCKTLSAIELYSLTLDNI